MLWSGLRFICSHCRPRVNSKIQNVCGLITSIVCAHNGSRARALTRQRLSTYRIHQAHCCLFTGFEYMIQKHNVQSLMGFIMRIVWKQAMNFIRMNNCEMFPFIKHCSPHARTHTKCSSNVFIKIPYVYVCLLGCVRLCTVYSYGEHYRLVVFALQHYRNGDIQL